MTELHGCLVSPTDIPEADRRAMHALMADHYDDTSWPVFLRDLEEKDACIVLRDGSGEIRGFSTQQRMSVTVDGRDEHGVFSGDTIIHRDWWGSMELYRVFARQYVVRETAGENRNAGRFWWFLISKGFKTYRMLPLFFRTYWPAAGSDAPEPAAALMRAFGETRYPGEYDAESGIIRYSGVKDRLKPGIADIGERQLKDRHIRFFQERNPGWAQGHDLVCLAELSEENLRPAAARLLFGDGEAEA